MVTIWGVFKKHKFGIFLGSGYCFHQFLQVLKISRLNSDYLKSIQDDENKTKKTSMGSCVSVSGIVNGNEKEDEVGFVDTHPGFVDGQALILLLNKQGRRPRISIR